MSPQTLAIVALALVASVLPSPRLRDAARAAPLSLTIVYPSEGAIVARVDRSFILGSADPGSSVSVNGMPAFVVPSGGWIAYVPFAPGRFRLHVVARKAGESVSEDRVVDVTPPLQTTPAIPARVDVAYTPEPADPMVLHAGDLVPLELKASAGAQVSASFGSSASVRLVRDTSEPVGGVYKGHVRLPRDAKGRFRVHYRVVAADGSVATATSKGAISVVPQRWNRVGYVVLADHRKDIDARPYGIIESSPDGDWLFFPPAQTPFEVTGSDGDYYRVALGATRQGWITKRSLKLASPGTHAPQAHIAGMEIHDGARACTLILHLSAWVPFSAAESVAGPGLRFRLYGAHASAGLSVDGDPASNIVAARLQRQSDDTAIVSVALRQRMLWGYSANWVGNDLAIVVKRPPVFAQSPASALAGLLVVVDPGHSPDPGAIGPLGTIERDVNLAIAKRLAAHLEDLGATVVLTRTENAPVGLYDRTALATRLGADVLISVHNNALPDGANPFAVHGFSVYYYQPQSLALAQTIRAAYLRDTSLMDGGTIRRDFALVRPSEEPAVLTESAFMIWPPEEMKLRDPAFQDKLARALADGMNRWASAARALEQANHG